MSQAEVPEVSYLSDVDGDLYMFADSRYPDRFDWLVTDYDANGSVRGVNQRAVPGDTFTGAMRRGDIEDACWAVSHQGRIEVNVPGTDIPLIVREHPTDGGSWGDTR